MKNYLYADLVSENRTTSTHRLALGLSRFGPKPTLGWYLFALFLLFLSCGSILRLLDPAAAVVDIGALSLPLLAVLITLGFIAISQWLLGLLWPTFRNFHNQHFQTLFKSLPPWQQILIYLCCFFLLLYACIACLAVVC